MSLSRELTPSPLTLMILCSHLSVCCFLYFYKLSSFVSFRLSAPTYSLRTCARIKG